MASIGEQIVQAMADALNAPENKPAKTWRTRIDAIGSGELPAFVLYALTDDPNREGPNTVLHTRTVRLECMVEGEPPADALTDPLYVFAVQTLFAWGDDETGYGANVRGLEEARVQWETEKSYADRCIAVVDFKVVFVTKATDPTVTR